MCLVLREFYEIMKEYGKEEQGMAKVELWERDRRRERKENRKVQFSHVHFFLLVDFLNYFNLNLVKQSLYNADKKGATPIEVCM